MDNPRQGNRPLRRAHAAASSKRLHPLAVGQVQCLPAAPVHMRVRMCQREQRMCKAV